MTHTKQSIPSSSRSKLTSIQTGAESSPLSTLPTSINNYYGGTRSNFITSPSQTPLYRNNFPKHNYSDCTPSTPLLNKSPMSVLHQEKYYQFDSCSQIRSRRWSIFEYWVRKLIRFIFTKTDSTRRFSCSCMFLLLLLGSMVLLIMIACALDIKSTSGFINSENDAITDLTSYPLMSVSFEIGHNDPRRANDRKPSHEGYIKNRGKNQSPTNAWTKISKETRTNYHDHKRNLGKNTRDSVRSGSSSSLTSHSSLREEFENWVRSHRRNYGSHEEKERRWNIWKSNHQRTHEKNKIHGPCRHTKQAVFGSNHFKDLSPEEFQLKYLSGYGSPKNLKNETAFMKTGRTSSSFPLRSDQRAAISKHNAHQINIHQNQHYLKVPRRHESVQARYLEHIQNTSSIRLLRDPKKHYHESYQPITTTSDSRYSSSPIYLRCDWFDVACWLRLAFGAVYGSFGVQRSHREPKFDADSYPSAVDWRQIGAVTDIHTQGNCGACWAISAVETIESANFIVTGSLLQLSETEVIACDSSCEMCQGGWPQNAYEYVMQYNGLPTAKSLKYDGDFLLALSYASSGHSSGMTESEMTSFLQSTCPSDKRGANQNNGNRFGAITGYAYATDRCVCYSNGQGCNCDEQDEDLAVANVASYGPATVCIDASTWQDYNGGIITSSSGCSSKFLDMNHCVQVVGYAFYTLSDESSQATGEGKNDRSNKEGGRNSAGHQTKREGYWIVRNQWSSYWGMNGFAYVAMGQNTCGILNDMTQVFLD